MSMTTQDASARRVAALVDRGIQKLAGRLSQKEIAHAAGMSPTMLSLVRHGHTKLPIERAHNLAQVLEIDPVLLVRNALEAALSPAAIRSVYATIGFPISSNEVAIVRQMRRASRYSDPALVEELVVSIERAFTSQKS